MYKNKDKWGALSMKDRALLMDMYLKNGIQELSEMKKHYNGIPYRDLNTSDYDYFNASPEMIPTEEGQHWDSRNPHTGRLLKGENHPTFDLAVEGENNAGYKIVRGYDGNLYSIPNQPDNYVEDYNKFGDGSWKETALLGASFVPFVGTGVDIYNLIKDPSWENAGWAALSLGSDVLGLTALRGLAKSAKLAKGVKAVKALEQTKTAEKYAEAVKKGIQLEHTGNPKKIALAAGRRGQAYYDNLVATRQLRDATVRAENLASKSKIFDRIDKTIDFYGNVINEKESLKNILYSNGGRILDGTETEQTTTGLPVGAGLATYNHPKYNHTEEAEMYSYLRSRGVPHVQASAIMGNIAVESMLNPEITQIGGGGGYGLIQATDKSRKKAFINYDGQPYEFGSNISPETQRQLDYIIDKGLNTQTRGEWRGNHNIGRASVARRKFLEATDINKASKIFTENYLRPGKPHTKRRKSMSNYFNDNYGITERALKEFENSFLFQNN